MVMFAPMRRPLAAASVCAFVVVLVFAIPLHLLSQEFAEEWVVELISTSSGANQQSFFCQTSEIFGLELWSEVVNREFAVAQFGEFAYEF